MDKSHATYEDGHDDSSLADAVGAINRHRDGRVPRVGVLPEPKEGDGELKHTEFYRQLSVRVQQLERRFQRRLDELCMGGGWNFGAGIRRTTPSRITQEAARVAKKWKRSVKMVRVCLMASDTRTRVVGQRRGKSRVEMGSGGSGAGVSVSGGQVAGVVRVFEALSFSRRYPSGGGLRLMGHSAHVISFL